MKKCEAFSKELHEMDACPEAIRWIQQNNYTLEEAWKHCDRGDWMLWYAAKVGVPIRPFILAKGLCAQLVEHLMQYQRSIQAVHTAIGFGHGEVTREELNRAADAAAAAGATAGAAAAYAATAAATATYATYASYAAAAEAATAAATDAADAAAAAERRNVLRQCADICRDVLTQYVMKEQS